ncbi:MAG: ATP-binding protein, partial [Acidobacteriota bacterium]|nr:ATP-binding protein [Acidobacteriota bacterium]
IGTVATGVAHDLNNQLTVILNHLDFALTLLEPTHRVVKHLHDVQRATLRSAEITTTLLQFGARTAVSTRFMKLEPVLVETERLLRRVIPSTIEIQLAVEDNLNCVIADATQIQQVLVNLSVNARDAMAKGGILSIRAGNHPGGVRITVSDTGSGMTEEVRRRIFEPFFTTKRPDGSLQRSSGSGLGLAMVASIIRSHAGRMEVESEPGIGTTFHIILPCATGEEPKPKDSKPTGNAPRGSGCILVADDDDLVRSVAAAALTMHGFRVIEARNGEEAVSLFMLHANEIDLVFFDMTMPRASGQEALNRARAIKPSIRALLTSGYEVAVKDPFLPKPYTSRNLYDKVDEVLAR